MKEDINLLMKELVDGNTTKTVEEMLANWQELISRYRCAIMEVETKFKVLNEQFSLQHERNPIESIKTRIKSPKSILMKMHKKQLPLTMSALEDNLNDIAGIRVICSFIDDIYMLADCLTSQDDIILIEKRIILKIQKKTVTAAFI